VGLVASTGFTGGYSHFAPLEQEQFRIFSLEKSLFNSAKPPEAQSKRD
jgi:hypothetical protein